MNGRVLLGMFDVVVIIVCTAAAESHTFMNKLGQGRRMLSRSGRRIFRVWGGVQGSHHPCAKRQGLKIPRGSIRLVI